MNSISNASSDFLLHCRFEKNLSTKTLKAYETDLEQLEKYLIKSSFQGDIHDISKGHLREYLISISNLKPKSIKRKIATIKALFNYLEFENKINMNPFRKMKIKIKEPLKLPSILDIKEIMKIFKVVYSRNANFKSQECYLYRESVRNIAVLELLFTTGARVSEIAGLKKEYINLSTGRITIKGKGNKERIIQVCNQETLAVLRHYCSLFEKRMEDTDGYFLVNRFNKQLSDQSIRNMIKKMSIQAGLTRRVTPHFFRHSFATLLLERDVDIKYIQSLLGHSSIVTTQIYTHVNHAKQKQILKTKHPRKDFHFAKSDLPMQDN
jgi:integrase/recombinase XerD